jgi:hypothetical protein
VQAQLSVQSRSLDMRPGDEIPRPRARSVIMSNWAESPKRSQPHGDHNDVCYQHGGKQWTATWSVENGRLIVSSAWGSRSEAIRDAAEPAARAAEVLQAMVERRTKRTAKGNLRAQPATSKRRRRAINP